MRVNDRLRGAAALQPRWYERVVAAVRDRRRGGRRVRGLRRLVALMLLAAAAALALVSPPAADAGSPAIVLTRDLPAGSELTAADVELVRRRDIPDGSLNDPAAATGRTLSGAIRRGEFLTDARVVAADGPDPGPGHSAVPVTLDRVDLALLRPGVHVVVIAVDETGSVARLTSDAVVLGVPTAPDGPGRIGESAGSRGATVVLAVPDAEADELAAAALTRELAVRFR